MRVPVPALLSMLVLSGCALPPIITVASLAANGISYATTGKGTADHAISAVAGEDCAILRAAKDEDICDPDGEVLLVLNGATTENDDWTLDPETGSPNPSAAPNELLAAVDPVPEPSKQPAAAPKAPAETVKGKRETSLDTLITLAAAPSSRGRFSDARPTAKPQAPQVQDQPTGWFKKLAAKTREIFKNPAVETNSTAP